MTPADFGFTRDKNDARAVEPHLNPLPRSILRPEAFELLDGQWRFALDIEDRGLEERWYLGHEYHDTANWPGSIESHLRSAQDTRQHTPPWQDQVVAWYERDFEVPAEWCEDPHCEVQVTFGACGYETRVWLNGHPLLTVEGEEVHFGEYTSFSYELPHEYLRPVNRLTVRIADSLDADIPRGKQESRVYKRGGIWYQTISGAVRSVWIEPVERNRLRSRLGIRSSIENRLVEFSLTTRVHDPGNYSLRLVVAARGSNQPLAVQEYALALEAGQKSQRIALELPDAALWSPDTPNLLQLVAQFMAPSGRVSQIETHFGLRKIEARGRHVYLNNQPLYLDGILYQPGTATFEQMRQHLLGMKQLGCNLVRFHIAGIDPRIVDLADELGILLWLEVPSPHSSSQRSRANHHAELLRMLVIIASHPSVVICSLYNEDWGAQDIATNAETRAYISELYDWMRLNYPQFLVVDNDGWHHISVEGALQSDLLTAHLYTPDIERWRELLDKFAQGKTEDVAVKPLVVGDPFFYGGQTPLIVSEWGGFGFSEYGGPGAPRTKAERIRDFKRELRARPIAGDVYTQAVSIEAETNGLIDPQSGELLVEPGLLNSHTPRSSDTST
jgi:beta-galactosidase/beta-glucuronidase